MKLDIITTKIEQCLRLLNILKLRKSHSNQFTLIRLHEKSSMESYLLDTSNNNQKKSTLEQKVLKNLLIVLYQIVMKRFHLKYQTSSLANRNFKLQNKNLGVRCSLSQYSKFQKLNFYNSTILKAVQVNVTSKKLKEMKQV